MSTSKHTPGPWHFKSCADGRTHAVPILANWKCDGAEPYHPLIAQALFGRGHANQATAKANAHLIAAAPDLLEALKAITAPQTFGTEGHVDFVDALKMASAAIAKAEGKS